VASRIELRHLLLEENEGEEEMGQLMGQKPNPAGPVAENKTKPKEDSPGNVWARKMEGKLGRGKGTHAKNKNGLHNCLNVP
jgi:hypothetical protein